MPALKHEDLSDELIEKIAERAAAKALEKVYTGVGKSVLTKLLWIFGAAGLALYMILKEKNLLP